ncbi:MAG: hypothetical protein WC372_10000 [Candidatus Neomarinimicrobiota bacterium]|jgi:hypothetical protein
MAWTQPTLPKVTAVSVPFKIYCAATVAPGDALYINSTSTGVTLADANDSKPCNAFAVTGGVSGDTIDAAIAVIMESNPSRSGDQYSATAIAAAADVGKPLYLSDTAGDVALSASSSIAQEVGYVLSTTAALLTPTGYLTATNVAMSGTLAVTGATTLSSTLAVTGNTTVGGTLDITGATTAAAITASGAVTASAGVVIGSAYGLQITEKNYTSSGAIATTGYVTLSADSADLAMTVAAPTAGTLLIIHDKANSGGKNHVVSAKAAGATFDGTNNTLTFDATGETIVLFAVTATQWVIVENIGSVAPSST